MAYATLGVAYGNLTQQSLSSENLRKAFDLKDRASEREKLYISAHLYDEDTKQVDKARDIFAISTRKHHPCGHLATISV